MGQETDPPIGVNIRSASVVPQAETTTDGTWELPAAEDAPTVWAVLFSST